MHIRMALTVAGQRWKQNDSEEAWQDMKDLVGKERNPESPKQDKPKAKHPKTHINQINKDQTQRTWAQRL